ncbi:hypothetical protein LOTGIDRAFT_176372 [Lottia gigantea]|uniref:Capsid protein n=1 Tax=Lottia gigantea TaxID=225164 RepID=V4BC61_LOTGI|nr:hypothetical protein LOTGIDRAFT_176372 [Lottia gigantea]ESP03692.1 hypothetical protein LOTGIDRAFT_176372 [Lottia gigantea]
MGDVRDEWTLPCITEKMNFTRLKQVWLGQGFPKIDDVSSCKSVPHSIRRRRAPVRRRTYRRRGNFMKNIYKGIVHSEHKASHEFNLGAKGVYTSNLCLNWHTFLTGTIKSQTSSYLNLFDEVKIRHVTLTYWLRNNGSNSLTYEQPTMTTTYDPDAQGRTMSIDNQNCCPNTRERLIRYGKKYKLRMYPKFQPKLSAAKSVAIGGKSVSPWIDAAYFTYGASPASSMNGIIYTLIGSPNTFVEGFYSVGLSWKGRRDGQIYTVKDDVYSAATPEGFEVLEGYDTVN